MDEDSFKSYLKSHIVKDKVLVETKEKITPLKLNPIEEIYSKSRNKNIGDWRTECNRITQETKMIKEYILDRDALQITENTYKSATAPTRHKRKVTVIEELEPFKDYNLPAFYKEWKETMQDKLFNAGLGSCIYTLKNIHNLSVQPFLFYMDGIMKGIVVDYYTDAVYGYRLISLFMENRNGNVSRGIGEYGNLYALYKLKNRYLNFGADVGRSGLRKFKEKVCNEWLMVYYTKNTMKR